MKHSCAYCGSEDTKVVTYTFRTETGPYVKGFKKNVCNVCTSESIPGELLDYNLELYNNSKRIKQYNNAKEQQ